MRIFTLDDTIIDGLYYDEKKVYNYERIKVCIINDQKIKTTMNDEVIITFSRVFDNNNPNLSHPTVIIFLLISVNN